VTPAAGKTLLNTGLPLRVIRPTTQGLKIGSYLGKIRLQSPQDWTVDVPVSLCPIAKRARSSS